VNSGPGSVTITVPEFYTSVDTFPLIVTVSDPTAQAWGFELSARTLNGQQAGDLISGTDGSSQLLSSSSNIQYIGHTVLGVRPGTSGAVSFNFMWQAPDVSAGAVVFNAAGNGANNNFSSSGDNIYTTEVMLQPQQTSGTPPAVPDGGVVDGASFALHPNPLAPGAIVSIFGSDLTDGSDGSSTFFDSNGKLTSTLGGAQVTFNGIEASLFAAFPTQLNVQIPTELTDVSSATVEVTVNGQTSTPRTVFIDPVSLGIFTVDSSGSGAGAILHADGSLVTGQNPVEAGQIIIIFCTGLGEVTPEVSTGLPATGLHTTLEMPTVTIDGLPAEVQFSGLAPGFVGLYQVNVVVPPSIITSSTISVLLTIGGKQSNQVTIAVLEAEGVLPSDDLDY